MNVKKIHALSVVCVGVALEHFDMMLVNLFATTLAAHFIFTSRSEQALVMGFLGYAISFLVRPLGAALFGAMGDAWGRKPSMLLSLLLMSLATLGLGLTPPFVQIGSLATFLFVVCRIVQGLSVGGEYGAAMTYSYELSRENKTLAGALVISATHIGGLAAACIAMQFPDRFQTAFRVAGVIGILSLMLRSFLVESRPVAGSKQSIKSLFQQSFREKGAYQRAFIIASSLVFTFYASLVYLNEIVFQKGLAGRATIFRSNILVLATWVVLPPFLGYLVDRLKIPYRKVMVVGSTFVVVSVAPLLCFAVARNSFGGWVFVQLMLSLFHSAFCFATPRYLGDQFGQSVRNTGVALGYSVGASFSAAATPLVCHGIVSFTGRVESISIPIGVLSGLAAIQLLRDLKPKRENGR